MKTLGGTLGEVRAARLRTRVGQLDRTLVVVESQELLRGQKRGIAAALKAKEELRKLGRRAAGGRIKREALESGVQKALRREHLADFVVAEVKESDGRLYARLARRRGATTPAGAARLGRRVLCTDRHIWSTGESCMDSAGSGMWRSCSAPPKKGRCVAMGTLSSMVRQLPAITHLRHRDWPRTGQPGTTGSRHAKVAPEGMMKTLSGIEGDISEGVVRSKTARTPCDGCARAGSDTLEPSCSRKPFNSEEMVPAKFLHSCV